jgi:hypothetical protein
MRPVRVLILMTAVTLAACGESTGVTGDELSEDEAAQLATAVLATAVTSATDTPDGPVAVDGPQAAPIAISYDTEFVAECELGGSVAVEASLDIEGDTEVEGGRIEFSMTQVHDGCVVGSESGMVFTLDGAPEISGTVVVEADGLGSIAVAGRLEGRVEWETEGRSGACPMVLEFAGAASETSETGEFAVAGSICGVAIEYAASIG